MENKNAIKLVDKILEDLDNNGINTDVLIDDIKALRTYALEAKVPLVVKVLRLTYEHIEATESFMIPMPDDEPIDEHDTVETDDNTTSPIESLKYVIALVKNLNNQGNIADLKEYRDHLNAY